MSFSLQIDNSRYGLPGSFNLSESVFRPVCRVVSGRYWVSFPQPIDDSPGS